MARCLSWVAALFVLPSLAAPAASRTWHITPTGTGDAASIQAGVDSAAVGDTVEAACGIYYEDNVTMKSGVTLRSETGDSDCVTVDAAGLGPTFICINQTVAMRIEGLTISGGRGNPGRDNGGGGLHCHQSNLTIADCRFTGNTSEFGGGMACYHSSPLLERCVFSGNSASADPWAAGGGIFCRDASPILVDCEFSLNTAFSTQLPGDGGGVFSQLSDLEATNCLFLGNTSGAGGGGFYSHEQDRPILTDCLFQGNVSNAGGGVFLETSFAEAIGCTFVDNSAANGGAIFMTQSSQTTMRECFFSNNTAAPNSGGAIDCWHSFPVVEDCTFRGNTAALNGGAMVANGLCRPMFEGCQFIENSAGRNGGAMSGTYAAAVDFRDCTLTANAAAGEGGAIYYELSGPLRLERSILAFSSAGKAIACPDADGVPAVICCNVHGNAGGDWVDCLTTLDTVAGNFSADPLFCDPENGDLFLAANSPCLPQSSPCGALVGALDAGCPGPVSVNEVLELTSWGAIKTRYRGHVD